MWHMPGHTYSRLHRYADAAWQQEASARVDHAHMVRDQVMPDQIHNYAHNNEWLIRDLIFIGRVGEATDLAKNYTQYAFWRGMVAPSMEAGMYIVPVPGNHETQCSTKVNVTCSTANGGKNAYAANENAWRANMSDLILDTTRFTNIVGTTPTQFQASNNPCPAGGTCTDNLTTDQTGLSYSFDVGGSHFVVINTDAVGRDSHAPTQWLSGDLAAAKARGVTSIFVFGHKPAYTYYYTGADLTKKSGLDIDATAAAEFWALIQQYGATYFCGHEHIFNASQPQGGTAYQMIVGSGGSPFDAPPTDPVAQDRMYAYSIVRVHQSGRVAIFNYGFKEDFSATTLISGPIIIPKAQ
jgi:hypothetical protein